MSRRIVLFLFSIAFAIVLKGEAVTDGSGAGHVWLTSYQGMVRVEVDESSTNVPGDGVIDYQFVLWRAGTNQDVAEDEFENAFVTFWPGMVVVTSLVERRSVILTLAKPPNRRVDTLQQQSSGRDAAAQVDQPMSLAEVESELREREIKRTVIRGEGVAVWTDLQMTRGDLMDLWAQHAAGRLNDVRAEKAGTCTSGGCGSSSCSYTCGSTSCTTTCTSGHYSCCTCFLNRIAICTCETCFSGCC